MSTALGSFVGSRVDPSPRTLALALGDAFLIALFVGLGEMSHGGSLARGLGTLIPFLIGWALVAPMAGVYSTRAVSSAGSAAKRTAVAWILAALVGQGLRATAFFHGDAALPFVLVSLGVGLALLVPWRVLAASLN